MENFCKMLNDHDILEILLQKKKSKEIYSKRFSLFRT